MMFWYLQDHRWQGMINYRALLDPAGEYALTFGAAVPPQVQLVAAGGDSDQVWHVPAPCWHCHQHQHPSCST